MKSMTIHKMDDLLLETIKSRAQEKGESVNATIKDLLAKAVGLENDRESDTGRTGYKRFLGRWTSEEEAAFDQATTDFALVDESDWTP